MALAVEQDDARRAEQAEAFQHGLVVVVVGGDVDLQQHRVGQFGAHLRLDEGQLFRSEEHTSELQSHHDIVCGLLLEKKKTKASAKAHAEWLTRPERGSMTLLRIMAAASRLLGRACFFFL